MILLSIVNKQLSNSIERRLEKLNKSMEKILADLTTQIDMDLYNFVSFEIVTLQMAIEESSGGVDLLFRCSFLKRRYKNYLRILNI